MLRRILLSGIFVALASEPALAVEVTIVTPNPDSAFITSIDANDFGYVAYPGPTFQLNDNKGKPWAGQMLTFSCSGAAFNCPKMLSKSAKTDQFGRASLEFTGKFKAAVPPVPIGRGAIIGTYKMTANWGSCSPGGTCVPSPTLVFNVLCNGKFERCVGVRATPKPAQTASTTAPASTSKPAKTASPAPKTTTAPASTSKPTLSVTDAAPIAVALTKKCRGASCDYSFRAIAHAKLIDSSGKPVKNAAVNIDFGKLAGSPWSSGTTAKTDADGIATLQTDFMYSSKAKPPPLDAGSKLSGHVTVSGAAYSSLKLDVTFVLR